MVRFTVGGEKKGKGQKLLSAGYKVQGWGYRGKAISNFIVGGALFVLGIAMAFAVAIPFLFVSLFGLILFFAGWFYWKRSNSLVKGRFY